MSTVSRPRAFAARAAVMPAPPAPTTTTSTSVGRGVSMARNCNRFYYRPVTSQGVTSPSIAAAVARLSEAQETGVPCAPVRDLIGTDDLAAAYAVQQGLVRRRLDGGVTVVGRKIGATSKAVQDQLGVNQPDFGYLLSDMDVSGRDPISMR